MPQIEYSRVSIPGPHLSTPKGWTAELATLLYKVNNEIVQDPIIALFDKTGTIHVYWVSQKKKQLEMFD